MTSPNFREHVCKHLYIFPPGTYAILTIENERESWPEIHSFSFTKGLNPELAVASIEKQPST